MNSQSTEVGSKVLVSDFDGTMTRHDFYLLAIDKLLPPDAHDHWADYRAGKITHFEGLQRYFADIRASEEEVLKVVAQMELDPNLANAVAQLRQHGWQIVIASAGCEWYIHRLLKQAGVDLPVHSNPGTFEADRGLCMTLPEDSPFFSPTVGIHKSGIVEHYLGQGATVAFAGDGFPDADAARLVPDDLRFARGDLADVLVAEGLPFHRFDVWSEIVDVLLAHKK